MSTSKDPLIVKVYGRFSFPKVFHKESFRTGEGKPAYSCTMLMDKKQNAQSIKDLQAAIDFLTKEEFGGKKLPPDKICMRDGSSKTDTEGYTEEIMYVAARNEKGPIGIVDHNLVDVTEEDGKIYGGARGAMVVRLWAQGGKSHKSQFGKRINATLRNVQFIKKDAPFGERVASPEEDGLTHEKVEDTEGVM